MCVFLTSSTLAIGHIICPRTSYARPQASKRRGKGARFVCNLISSGRPKSSLSSIHCALQSMLASRFMTARST